MNRRKPYLVLLSSGLDDILRGQETATRILFEALKREALSSVTPLLLKRDGPKAEDEVRLFTPRRSSWLARVLGRVRGSRFYWAQVCFACVAILFLALGRKTCAALITLDPMVLKVIWAFRSFLKGHPPIVFIHGVRMEPHSYATYCDVLIEVNQENHDRSCAAGFQSKAHLIPHFEFQSSTSEEGPPPSSLREELKIETEKVLLGVGVVDRTQKRADYLIREVSQLGTEWTLLLCGSVTEPEILEFGKKKLGNRFRHCVLRPERMGEAYGLANLFVLGSLDEGFGLVVMEAMKYGCPVLVHRRKHFLWLVGDEDQTANLQEKGAIKAWLEDPLKSDAFLNMKGDMNRLAFQERFTWERVRSQYLRVLGVMEK